MTSQPLNRPCGPVPTIAQRKALHADHDKRYARQYRDNQDGAIAEMHAARIRYEVARAERAEQEVRAADGVACCATNVADEATEIPLARFLAICIASLGLWAAIGYATWWVAPFAADFLDYLVSIIRSASV